MDGTNGSSPETLNPPPEQARTTATMTPLFVPVCLPPCFVFLLTK